MDFYKALGVSRTASKQEVRDAWRKQALENHPDRLQEASDFEKQDALRKFNRAKEAYEVLGDESKRALYDSSGRSAVYAAERTGRSQSGPFRSAYAAPRTRTGWSNFWYQQQQYNTHGAVFGTMNPFRAFMRGMGRTDMYFHAAFGVILVAGFVFVAPLVDNIWHHLNRGKLFRDIRTDSNASAGRVARPVLIGDREERLRAQGVPASIVASMRAFEEQQLRQKPAPMPSPTLSAEQAPEPDEAHSDSLMRTSNEQQLQQKLLPVLPSASLSAKEAPELDGALEDSSRRLPEEQQPQQKLPPVLSSAGLNASQALEPYQAPDDFSAPTDQSAGTSTTSAENMGSTEEGLTAASAAIDFTLGDSHPGADQSSASAGLDGAASVSGRAEALQISTAPLGQDHDRAGAAEGSVQAEKIRTQLSQGTSKDSSKEASVHSKQDATQH